MWIGVVRGYQLIISMNKTYLCIVIMLLSASVQAFGSTKSTPKRVEVSATSSFASQVRNTDTYYVIKDVIDLKGATITIPKDCTLKMEGGYLTNGTIYGSETYIDATPNPVFSSTLQLVGSFVATEAYPEWFDNADDAVKIRKALKQFDNVKLTALHYVLNSVDTNGYGIVVPEGHILRGNRRANNTKANDQVIKMAEGVNYTAVVALESSTVLTDLTIWGANKEYTSCVTTIGEFQSRITIERVGVSGAYYGFNLQIYLSNISQCVANYNEVGFYLHGHMEKKNVTVEGTSINLSTCYAVDSKKAGYELVGITYSTMNNCAADGCGAPTSGTLQYKTEIGYGYSFTQCKCITINSCGVENGLAAVKTMTCRNIVFNTPSFLINKRKDVKVAKDYKMKPILNIRYSVCIEFKYMYLYSKGMEKYYTSTTPLMLLYGSDTSLPSVILNNGYEGLKESNIGTEGFLTKAKHLQFKQ